MQRKEQPTQRASGDRSSVLHYRRRSRRRVFLLLALVLAALLVVFGRGVSAWYARQMAARHLQDGALSGAQRWLAWSAWFEPDDGRTDLMQAACFRQRQQVDEFVRALESAGRKGVPASQIRGERDLARVQAGQLDERPRDQIDALLDAGLPPQDVATAFVYGFLVGDKPEEAKNLLDAWTGEGQPEAQIAFLRGIHWQWLGEPARARTEFETALAVQPRHELARASLAELLEEQDSLAEALAQYGELASRVPESSPARVGVARLLRKLGRLGDARSVLEAWASQFPVSVEVAAEWAQVAFESGDQDEAVVWLTRAGLESIADGRTLREAATALALIQDPLQARPLFARADAVSARTRRVDELRTRLAVEPRDRQAADELDRSVASLTRDSAPGASRTEAARDDLGEGPVTPGSELYVRHCSACHGDRGQGDGRAAKYLFPRPPSLRPGKFKLVSTSNGVAALADLDAVIRLGMPGTSMPSFPKLADGERKLLAEEVRRMSQEGVREKFMATLQDAEEEIDEQEVRQAVRLHTEPGPAVRVPPFGPADTEAMARGKEVYVRLGCHNCHGDDGTGARDNPLFDDQGLPVQARDLVREPFKGGHEPEAIYLRIVAGMPGTAHPNSSIVPEHQLVDLVQYCRGLAREPKRVLTNHERFHQATGRGQLGLPSSPSASTLRM